MYSVTSDYHCVFELKFIGKTRLSFIHNFPSVEFPERVIKLTVFDLMSVDCMSRRANCRFHVINVIGHLTRKLKSVKLEREPLSRLRRDKV